MPPDPTWPLTVRFRRKSQIRQLVGEHHVEGMAALWLYVVCSAYAHEYQTGGFVPRHVIGAITHVSPITVHGLTRMLVRAGLMEVDDDLLRPGYRVLPAAREA